VCAGSSLVVRVFVFAPPALPDVALPIRKALLLMFGMTAPFMGLVASTIV
jgi:hypothetical protein